LATVQYIEHQQPQPTLLDALDYFVTKEDSLATEMKAFLAANFDSEEWIRPAQAIVCLMDDARAKLSPFVGKGITPAQSDTRLWTGKIVEFWDYICPHGWQIREHREPELRTFVQKIFDFAIYIGIKDMLKDMDFNPPAAPEPSSQPAPPPQQMALQVAPQHLPPQTSPIKTPRPSTRRPSGRAVHVPLAVPKPTVGLRASSKSAQASRRWR
jgi:hypothetical protein